MSAQRNPNLIDAAFAALIRSQRPAAAAAAMFRNHDARFDATRFIVKPCAPKSRPHKSWQLAVLRA